MVLSSEKKRQGVADGTEGDEPQPFDRTVILVEGGPDDSESKKQKALSACKRYLVFFKWQTDYQTKFKDDWKCW